MCNKSAPVSYHDFFIWVKDNFATIFFGKGNFEEIARYYFKHQQQDHNFIRNFKQAWDKEAATLRMHMQKLRSSNLSNISDSELTDLFVMFSKKYMHMWHESIFIDSFDVMGEVLLSKAIEREKKVIETDDLEVLIAVPEYSWLQRERRALLQLVEDAQKNEDLLHFFTSGGVDKELEKTFPLFYEKVEKHADHYHWIYYDYAVMERLEPSYFLEQLRDLLQNPDIYANEKLELKRVEKVRDKKQKLQKRLGLSNAFMNVIHFLSTLAVWRDDRKAHNQMGGGVAHMFAQEYARRTGINLKDIEQLFWWEVPDVFDEEKRVTVIRRVQERSKGYLFYGVLEEGNLIYGNDARELVRFAEGALSSGTEVKGRPAYRGVVKGRVKIVRHQGEFSKMKQGDILVAPNTRPEYVPIMKLAGAIVSEEGGITSHTAIVSRELKIPAVVGAQGALGILHDGDMVEVDAENGIVRKV